MRAVVLLLLYVLSNTSAAQTVVETMSMEPGDEIKLISAEINSSSERSMEFQLSNGTAFVIDDALNKIFVSNAQGVHEMSLDAALLEWANGDSAKAGAAREKFRATLNDPMREITLTSDQFQSSQWRSGTTCLSADASCGGDGLEFGSYSAAVTGFQDSGWGSYTLTFRAFHPPEEEEEDDRRDWERWRQDKCDDASNHLFAMALAVAGAGVACPAAVTLVPIVGCVASASGFFWELDNWADDSVDCNAPYPGPGGW